MSVSQPYDFPVAASAPPVAPWRGVAMKRHLIPPDEFADFVPALYTIDVHLSHPYELEWKHGRRYRRTPMVRGALCISSVAEPISLRWRDNLEIVRATLSPAILASTAESLQMRGAFTIPERHGDVDAQVAHICQALWAEARAEYPLGRVFGESLGTALAACLLQRYSNVSGAPSAPGQLSPRAWKAVQELVEDQLHTDISLDDMAATARLSPYHFARCFKETAGTTPHQYLIARRVERARQLLAGSDQSLAQVAIQTGFADQSHLTRHMKRLLGQTPSAFVQQRSRRLS